MKFSIEKAIEILERTPATLSHLLTGLSDDWTAHNEGGDTWAVYDVIGHLIHGDKTDWLIRAELILSEAANKTFEAFDRFAQFENSKGKNLSQLLIEFQEVRLQNLTKLQQLNIQPADLQKTGIHPVFGEVTLSQLLATWVAHDLDHISQISRIMAKQYKEEIGPWIAFLKVLNQ